MVEGPESGQSPEQESGSWQDILPERSHLPRFNDPIPRNGPEWQLATGLARYSDYLEIRTLQDLYQNIRSELDNPTFIEWARSLPQDDREIITRIIQIGAGNRLNRDRLRALRELLIRNKSEGVGMSDNES